ncbi:MAG: 4-amino-4-deoxy-L-arabinose transferase-like glycosyltransferase [Paraglaciecola sp.]
MPKKENLQASNSKFHYLTLALLLPALLINLGLVAFINDEAIRALVALEMDLSGNYITPTMFGEYYYNKPPLYNWILLVFSNIYGYSNEFISRLPTVVFLLAYAATIYHFSRKYFSQKWAFINAFALITCGRILFYDSFLGLIDICFSWTIYSMFMVVYHRWKAGKYYQLFGIAYTLTALAFLMKGLPAIVFLGTTLLAHFIYQKQFKKLFLPAHFFGMGIFVAIVGGYYFAYHQYNDLSVLFTTLFVESAKRTPIEYGFLDTVLHLFSFPFEMVFHFLPWSFLVIYLFQKKLKSRLESHPFIAYNALIFATTIPLYWISVEVYPRYLFMHVPLIFSVLFYLHNQQKAAPEWQFKLIEKSFALLKIIAPIAIIALPFLVENVKEVSYFYLKWSGVFIAAVSLIFVYFYKKSPSFLTLIALLLVLRIGFDWFILPSREKIERTTVCRESAKNVGQNFQKETLYNYKNSLGWNPATAYYITNERQLIFKSTDQRLDSNAVFIINQDVLDWGNFEDLQMVEVPFEGGCVYVGKLVKREK